jgi:hypothetical protein
MYFACIRLQNTDAQVKSRPFFFGAIQNYEVKGLPLDWHQSFLIQTGFRFDDWASGNVHAIGGQILPGDEEQEDYTAKKKSIIETVN